MKPLVRYFLNLISFLNFVKDRQKSYKLNQNFLDLKIFVTLFMKNIMSLLGRAIRLFTFFFNKKVLDDADKANNIA